MNKYTFVIIFIAIGIIQSTHSMEKKGITQNGKRSPKKTVTFNPRIEQKSNNECKPKGVERALEQRFPNLSKDSVVVGDDPLEQAIIDALLAGIEPDGNPDDEEFSLNKDKTEKNNKTNRSN